MVAFLLFLVAICLIPVLTVMLSGRKPVLTLFKEEKSSAGFEKYMETLRGVQAEIDHVSDPDEDHDRTVTFKYQGGYFISVYNMDGESPMHDCVSISFFRCFDAPPEQLDNMRRIMNRVAGVASPIKASLHATDEGDKIEVNLHTSGLRFMNPVADAEYLHTILTGFFDMRRFISSEYEQLTGENPPSAIEDLMPTRHVYHTIMKTVTEAEAKRWDGIWHEAPKFSLAEILDRLTGSRPTDDATITINGDTTELKAGEYFPLEVIFAEYKDGENADQFAQITVDTIEPDALMHRNFHVILRGEAVDGRLVMIRVYAMTSGLSQSRFRPIGSPETLPQAFSSAIGIYLNSPENFQAESEYMAEDQGLVERLQNPDAAYCFYWGKTLFSSDRFVEASHYLQNAYDILAPSMTDPTNEPEEKVETFFETCFLLGISYYQTGRYRDSYYYLDIIVNQHRVKWTEQYILTLVALNDPRIESMMDNLRGNLVSTTEGEDSERPAHIAELIDFIDCQKVMVQIKRGQVDEARHTLEERLRSNPDDPFALHWLATLG